MAEQSKYQDFIWIHPNLKRGRATGDVIRTARSEWWSESRSMIMSDMKKWLDKGWIPITEIGPDCWEIKETKEMWCTLWGPWQWIMWFLLLLPSYGLVFFPASIYRPVSFKIPMRKLI